LGALNLCSARPASSPRSLRLNSKARRPKSKTGPGEAETFRRGARFALTISRNPEPAHEGYAAFDRREPGWIKVELRLDARGEDAGAATH
jgi:hypothetical protein